MDKLVTAQCVTDDPAPLLQAAGDVIALADVLRPNATAQPFTTEAEHEIWDILGELKACCERDRGQQYFRRLYSHRWPATPGKSTRPLT